MGLNVKEGQVLRWNKPQLDADGELQFDGQGKVMMQAQPLLIQMDDDVAIAEFVASEPEQAERLKAKGMLWDEPETNSVLRRKALAEARALKDEQKDEGVVLDLVGGQEDTTDTTDPTDADNA